MQRTAQWAGRGDWKALPGRVDAVSVSGTPVQGRYGPGQRRPRLLPLGGSVQHLGARAKRADRRGEWQRVAFGSRERQVCESPYPVSAGFLQQERGWPHRRSEYRLERQGAVDDAGHAYGVPQRRWNRVTTEGLQGSDASRSARALSGPQWWSPRLVGTVANADVPILDGFARLYGCAVIS